MFLGMLRVPRGTITMLFSFQSIWSMGCLIPYLVSMTFILSNKDFWTVLNDKWFISLNKRCVGYVNFFCNVIFMPQNACSSLVVKQFLSEFLLIAVIRDYSSVEDDQSCGCRFPIS